MSYMHEPHINTRAHHVFVMTVKAKFRPGTRIELISMDDKQAVPRGTKGSVVCVDDMGQLIMRWDNGRTLSLLPGADDFKIIEEAEQVT